MLGPVTERRLTAGESRDILALPASFGGMGS